jgi:hypothetical protein
VAESNIVTLERDRRTGAMAAIAHLKGSAQIKVTALTRWGKWRFVLPSRAARSSIANAAN